MSKTTKIQRIVTAEDIFMPNILASSMMFPLSCYCASSCVIRSKSSCE